MKLLVVFCSFLIGLNNRFSHFLRAYRVIPNPRPVCTHLYDRFFGMLITFPVQGNMLILRHYLKIFGTIILFVPVEMVNYFILCQWPSEMFFHHITMLEKFFAIHPYKNIAFCTNGDFFALRNPLAFAGAVIASIFYVPLLPFKFLTALIADQSYTPLMLFISNVTSARAETPVLISDTILSGKWLMTPFTSKLSSFACIFTLDRTKVSGLIDSPRSPFKGLTTMVTVNRWHELLQKIKTLLAGGSCVFAEETRVPGKERGGQYKRPNTNCQSHFLSRIIIPQGAA